MNEALLTPRGGSRDGSTLRPLYFLSFLRALALAVASLPACSLRIQELAVAAGGDSASAALVVGATCALRHVGEFVASQFLLSWSERVGRQPVLLVSCSAFVVESAFMALASSSWFLAAVYSLGGVMFTGGALESLCIEDTVKNEDESAAAHGHLFGAVGFALSLGPALGGYLVLQYGGAAPLACAHVLGIVVVCGVVFCLPEYMPLRSIGRRRSRQASVQRSARAQDSLRESLWRVPGLRWCCCALALNGLGMASFAAVDVLWMQASLGWHSHELGVFVGFGGCLQLLGQGVVLPWLLQITRGRMLLIAKICLFANALKFVGFASATDIRWMFFTLFAASPGCCGTPVLANLCTRHLPKEAQQPMNFLLSVLNTVASAAGALVGSSMLAQGLRGQRFLGAPLLFAAACFFLAGACVTQADRCMPRRAAPGRCACLSKCFA